MAAFAVALAVAFLMVALANSPRTRAFLTGIREFRTDLTTHYDPPLDEAYDTGRDLAHAATLRRYDHN